MERSRDRLLMRRNDPPLSPPQTYAPAVGRRRGERKSGAVSRLIHVYSNPDIDLQPGPPGGLHQRAQPSLPQSRVFRTVHAIWKPNSSQQAAMRDPPPLSCLSNRSNSLPPEVHLFGDQNLGRRVRARVRRKSAIWPVRDHFHQIERMHRRFTVDAEE